MLPIQSTLLALGAFLTVGSAAAQSPDSVGITSTRVADGVYLLQGSGGNIGVSAGEGRSASD